MRLRDAAPDDLDQLVEVDLKAFAPVYRHYGLPPDELRAHLRDRLRTRLELLEPGWMPVIFRGDDVLGFVVACPTNRGPDSFVSWEDMTDEGSLRSTHDPRGRYVYIVTVSLRPDIAHQELEKMLFGAFVGQLIKHQAESAFFESRIPGFRSWVRRECRRTGRDVPSDAPELHGLAERYVAERRLVRGRHVRLDPLLRTYESAGCRFHRVMPNGYQDADSMNFGVLGSFANPLPARLRRSRLASGIAGRAVVIASGHHQLIRRFF